MAYLTGLLAVPWQSALPVVVFTSLAGGFDDTTTVRTVGSGLQTEFMAKGMPLWAPPAAMSAATAPSPAPLSASCCVVLCYIVVG